MSPPWIKKPKDPEFRYDRTKTYKYVDDEVNTSKVNMRKARLLLEGDQYFKEIVDTRSQNLLQHIASRARQRGMAINAAKTGLMIVSAASSFKPRVRLELEGQEITGQDSMRVLGVTIDSDATFKSHVEKLSSKMRSKTWALAKLRKNGLSQEKLVRTYTALIRPTVEYASPVWHISLTASQSALLEKQQSQALKNIFGPELSAEKLRKKANIDLLCRRREEAVKKFARKCPTNQRCQSWFVQRPTSMYPRRATVAYPSYRETLARNDRHRNNPMNYVVRKLNEA